MILVGILAGCSHQQSAKHPTKAVPEPMAQRYLCNKAIEECETLALAGYHSDDVELQERSLYLMQELCGRKSAVACEGLGIVQAGYGKRIGFGIWYDDVAGADNLLFACVHGRALACNNLGVSYAEGRGVSEDQFKAVEFFRRACDGDDGRGCANLAYRYSIGVGIERSLEMELITTERSCDLDDALGCANLGVLYSQKGDDEGALKLYHKACNLGRLRACVHFVSQSFDSGNIGPHMASKTYAEICELGEAEGCRFGAELAFTQENNRELGQALAEKSCSLGSLHGCRMLGDIHQGNFGGTPDYIEANRLYDLACRHRVHAVPEACLNLADNIENGRGSSPDPDRAKALRERALQY